MLDLPGGCNASKKRAKSHASCCENSESSRGRLCEGNEYFMIKIGKEKILE